MRAPHQIRRSRPSAAIRPPQLFHLLYIFWHMRSRDLFESDGARKRSTYRCTHLINFTWWTSCQKCAGDAREGVCNLPTPPPYPPLRSLLWRSEANLKDGEPDCPRCDYCAMSTGPPSCCSVQTMAYGVAAPGVVRRRSDESRRCDCAGSDRVELLRLDTTPAGKSQDH